MNKQHQRDRSAVGFTAICLLLILSVTFVGGESNNPVFAQELRNNHMNVNYLPEAMNEIFSWSPSIQVSNKFRARWPDITANIGEVQVNYDNIPTSGTYEMLYEAGSTDNGHSFSQGVYVDRDHAYLSGTPIKITEDNQGNIYMVWRSTCQEPQNLQCGEPDWLHAIYFRWKNHVTGQWSFPHEISLTKNANGASIAVGSDGVLHVVYVHSLGDPQNENHQNSEIVYLSSSDKFQHYTSVILETSCINPERGCVRHWTNGTTIAVDAANRPHVVSRCI